MENKQLIIDFPKCSPKQTPLIKYKGRNYQVKKNYPNLVVAYLLDDNGDKIISLDSKGRMDYDLKGKPWYEKRIIMKNNIGNT